MFIATSIPGYAAANVRTGRWTESEALDNSRREFDTLLPQGFNSKDHFFYTLYKEKEAIGMAWLKATRSDALKKGFIYKIFIEENHRGQGHGKSLMRLLEEKAREMGLNTLALHVFGSNKIAINLYNSIGYEITNINMSKAL